MSVDLLATPVLLGVALAVLVGVSLGLLGGGGSILTVPILVYVIGVAPHEAIALSLLVVGATSLAALVPHARAGHVRWKTGAVFGGASMVGAFAAGRLASHVPGALLLLLFGAMMLITAAFMMRARPAGTDGEEAEDEPGQPERLSELPIRKILGEGLLVGAATGLVGAGGGFLVVPALVLLGKLPMRVAVGTSLLVISMNSLAAFAGHVSSVTIDWPLATVLAAAAIGGSVGGAALAGHVPAATLRRGFAWMVVAMAIFVLVREAPGLA